MLIYLIVFILVCGLMQIAYKNEKNKFYSISLIMTSVLVLVLLAALRSTDIGTDVNVYQIPIFERAGKHNSFLEYCKACSYVSQEYLYLLLNFLLSRVFSDIHWFFFFMELIILVPVYYVIWKERKEYNPALCLMVYCFLFYVETFNTLRQNLAIAYSLLAIWFWKEKKNKKAVISFLCAFMFHRSAVIILVVPVLLKLLNIRNRRKRDFLILLTGGVVMLLTLEFYNIAWIIYKNFHVFPYRYITEIAPKDEIDIPVIYLVTNVLCFLLLLLIRKREKIKDCSFLLLLSVMTNSLVYVSSAAVLAYRLGWYFEIFDMFSFSACAQLVKKDTINKTMYTVFLFAFLAVCWWYNYAYAGSANVYPYRFL
jgi:hypothetical protein